MWQCRGCRDSFYCSPFGKRGWCPMSRAFRDIGTSSPRTLTFLHISPVPSHYQPILCDLRSFYDLGLTHYYCAGHLHFITRVVHLRRVEIPTHSLIPAPGINPLFSLLN